MPNPAPPGKRLSSLITSGFWDCVVIAQSIAEFLKDLPSHDTENFSLFNTENGIRTSLKRPSVYLPTDEMPADQGDIATHWIPLLVFAYIRLSISVIVTEKKSILLRYLHQQWEKKVR